MSVGAIIYLVVLLLFFIGGFIFFIVMDYQGPKHMAKKAQKKPKEKVKKSNK